MNRTLRILIVILCIVALYYLVVLLARSVARDDDVGLAPAAPRASIAARGPGGRGGPAVA